MNFGTKIRLTHGMHWRSTNPRFYDYPKETRLTIRTVFGLLFVGALWGWMMDRDYLEQAAQDRAAYASVSATLVECMNGEARWVAEDGGEVGCLKAQTNEVRK